MANVFKNMTIMGPRLSRTLTGSTLLQRRFCSDQVRVKRPVNGASDDRRAPNSRDAGITRQLTGGEITHSASAGAVPSGSLYRSVTQGVAIQATPDKESKELETLQKMTDEDIQELKRRLDDIVAQNQKLQERIGELKSLLGLNTRQQQLKHVDDKTGSRWHCLLALIYKQNQNLVEMFSKLKGLLGLNARQQEYADDKTGSLRHRLLGLIYKQNQKLQENVMKLKGLLGLNARSSEPEQADDKTDSFRHQVVRLLELIYKKIRDNPQIALRIIGLCYTIYSDIITGLLPSPPDTLALPEAPEDSEISRHKYYIYALGLGVLLPVVFLLM